MNALIDPKYIPAARQQLQADLIKRSTVGTYIYPLIWLAIMLPALMTLSRAGHLIEIIIMTTLVCSASLIRICCNKILRKNPEAILAFSAGVGLSAAVWGGISGYMLLQPAFAECQIPLLFATAGLCAGGITALAPLRNLAWLYLTFLCAPLFLAFQSGPVANANSIMLLLGVFIIGLTFLGLFLNKEYYQGLNTRLALQEKTEKLAELNTIDALTGMKNKRFFDCQLAYEFRRSIREAKPISVILLRQDNLTDIQTEYGDSIGEECVKEMARVIASLINRSMDIVARYDEQEFAIMLPHTALENARQLAERIRTKVEGMSIRYGEEEVCFTSSLGVACCIPSPGRSEMELLGSARQALNDAIQSGHNRIELSEDDSNVTSLLSHSMQKRSAVQ